MQGEKKKAKNAHLYHTTRLSLHNARDSRREERSKEVRPRKPYCTLCLEKWTYLRPIKSVFQFAAHRYGKALRSFEPPLAASYLASSHCDQSYGTIRVVYVFFCCVFLERVGVTMIARAIHPPVLCGRCLIIVLFSVFDMNS